MGFGAVVIGLVGCLIQGAVGSTECVPINLAPDAWTWKSQGAWRTRCDHRDLLAMRHPWVESAQGNFAWASRDVTVPDDWQGKVYLDFYCSDDYAGPSGPNDETWRADGSWLTAEGFVGHRFKQVLVDDHVVWSADVADPVLRGVSPTFRVEIPVKAGQKFLLTLLVFDTVESKTPLEKDFYQSANNEKKRESDPDAARFQTHVYWGDIALNNGAEPLKAGARPSEKKVRAVHTRRWPLPPFGEVRKGPVMLDVSAPGGIPKQGFPARCGVPIVAGKVKNVQDIALKAKDGHLVAAQKTVLGKWADESVQWVLLDFPVAPGLEQAELAFTKDWAAFDGKVKAAERDGGVHVNTNGVQFDAKPGDPLSNIQWKGAAKISSVALGIQVKDEDIAGTTESVSVVDDGPFRYTLELEGRFDSLERTVAHYRIYCSAYWNLPYIALELRLFNDTPEDLPVSSLKMRVQLPAEPAGVRVPSGDVKNGFVLRQVSEKSRELDGAPVDPLAPMFVAWKNAVLAVRQFRELYPKEISAKDKELVVDLVAAGKTPVIFTPGEAKSHEIWLALGEVDAAKFAAAVSQPPVLQNGAYFCSTGVLGPAAPHDGAPVLHDHMANDFGKRRWEDLGQVFGVRDFPDAAYYGGLPKWCNNYYERMLGLWSEWFMSGDRAWHDLACDVCRHLMDVAIVHSEVSRKDWAGSIHGPGENHVSGPWDPALRIEGLRLYQKLTGDPDAREAFLGVADYCVRTHAGTRSGSARDHGGPFDAICTAYQETGEVKYLDEGALHVQSVLKCMDVRRGAWPEEHGSKVYRGNVPWMVAQVARPLYLWYRATGDLAAAQALVGLAESIVCENTDWDAPGVVSGYSHNPHYPVSATYDLLILPVIFAAYELTEDTFFLDAAKAQWERWLREKAFDSPLNCYWNTPWLMWCLKHYGIASAPAGTDAKPRRPGAALSIQSGPPS